MPSVFSPKQLADEKGVPVVAFVEDVAASGGYWLATAGDEIYADDNSINVESDDGSFSAGATTELPDEWPSEIPEPDGLAINSASVIGSDTEQAITVSGSVDSDEFVDSYGARLGSAGFDEESTFSSNGTINNVYTNGTWTVGIVYFADAADNQVTVSVYSS